MIRLTLSAPGVLGAGRHVRAPDGPWTLCGRRLGARWPTPIDVEVEGGIPEQMERELCDVCRVELEAALELDIYT